MATIKEHGILFSSAMVRAILAGTKSQTRRLYKHTAAYGWPEDLSTYDARTLAEMRPEKHAPHGPVGRRLYVKETWATSIGCDKRKAKDLNYEGWPIWYRADDKVRFLGADTGGPAFMTSGKTRPSIFMPPWASRIALEVTRVRVERVGDISEEDARAEGVDWAAPYYTAAELRRRLDEDDREDPREVGYSSGSFARQNYVKLWDEINGAGSFAASPWVWVYDFRRVG